MIAENENIFNMEVNEMTKAHLLDTARWTKFLALVGFIGMGLGLIFVFFFGAFMSSMMSRLGGYSRMSNLPSGFLTGIMFVYWLIAVAIYFYPVFALYKFSKLVKPALNTNNQEMLNESLGYLKGYYKYRGILTIIGLVLFVIYFLFMLVMIGSVI